MKCRTVKMTSPDRVIIYYGCALSPLTSTIQFGIYS
jgi:hypothetical protein